MVHGPVREVVRGPSPLDWSTDRGSVFSGHPRWGTCFVSLDGGFSREMIFQHKLNPHNGLYLEIYANESREKVGLKYTEVSIGKEN